MYYRFYGKLNMNISINLYNVQTVMQDIYANKKLFKLDIDPKMIFSLNIDIY